MTMRLPRVVTGWLALLSGVLAAAGLVVIVVYCFATDGPHARYLAVALTTGMASFLVGCLAGFLFGIPRVVSTGALRLTQDGKVSDDPKPDAVTGQFTPSTNLSEISDWLTKLLLGAGLVQLGSLARLAGVLVHAIAQGISTTTTGTAPVSAGATAMAGAILVTYVVLGFLDGYVVTTLWYGRRLSEMQV
ncbi:hypothetical protein [Pseudonocardia charpentierae]|uniref:MotA/TolQ/ExbB proton channel family protein n=1 Tax=Pseudonocardia charpentierae TaxID=3075545 RepID=A0ABU2NHK3_9PSEU|nr:hypothetical protein [Pseudonocardia sp. DSM 45834]MDT0353374.1 hypothetical protein [Pseudonocardia sp. DSM 45834]